MAVIEARGRGYRVRVRIKGFPPQSAAFERLTDARRWAQQTEAAIREGRHFKTNEANKHSVAQLVDRYVRDVIPQKKPSSRGTQKAQLEWCGLRLIIPWSLVRIQAGPPTDSTIGGDEAVPFIKRNIEPDGQIARAANIRVD